MIEALMRGISAMGQHHDFEASAAAGSGEGVCDLRQGETVGNEASQIDTARSDEVEGQSVLARCGAV
jgi:hypothetical protein